MKSWKTGTGAGLVVLALALLVGWWLLHSKQRERNLRSTAAEGATAGATAEAIGTDGGHSTFHGSRFTSHVSRLTSRFGTNRIEELLNMLAETPGGAEMQMIVQALALRKQEALPVVRERLRNGTVWEKHMLAKFLGQCPWKETREELLALAGSESEHWLPRQSAVFALGALGDVSVGAAIVAVLNSPKATLNLQMAAVSTLARIGFRDAVAVIKPFAQAENLHLRLFAARALAELGEPGDKGFLVSALRNEDYVVRQEASESLGKVDGKDVTEALQSVAENDPNEAVRAAAAQTLLRREIAGRKASEKIEILRRGLDSAERLTALWILRTALEEAGVEGRAFLTVVAERDDFLGERSRGYIVLMGARSQ